MAEIDFRKFKNESFFQKLKETAYSEPDINPTYVFFGGTGAVGGQAVIEIIQAYRFIVSVSPVWKDSHPLIVATGLSDEEIDNYRKKLDKVFRLTGNAGFEEIIDASNTAKRVLRDLSGSGVTIELHRFSAEPEFTVDLAELIRGKNINQIKETLGSLSTIINSPFQKFLHDYFEIKKYDSHFRFKAVISGIPIPSVAAYFFSKKIEDILDDVGVQNDNAKEIERAINIKVLHSFANDFGSVKKHLADEVLIAHTTSVGGMYTIEGNKPVIRLGYAHSALDEQLLEKQFYANELTKEYSGLGLKTLITAAAIGIDNVFTRFSLPLNKSIYNRYRHAKTHHALPFKEELLDYKCNYIYTPVLISPSYPSPESKNNGAAKKLLEFVNKDENQPVKLEADFGLRSGENGVFSIDNAYALYLNMKIATQEELAHILAFNALLGDDKQKPWFDNDGICYQTETENSIIAFALLNNRAEFRASQTSAFTPKAFQDLGSSKHQCELHTIGLYMLLHRLKTFDTKLISDKACTESDIVKLVDENTRSLTIEDVAAYNPVETGNDFSKLLTLQSPEDLVTFVGYDGNSQLPHIRAFFRHLFNVVKKTINTITSLGTPIVFNLNDEIKVLSGPYCAPIDSVISYKDTLSKYIKDDAIRLGLELDDYFEWLVCNNGFIDLRPQATISTAKTHKNGLRGEIKIVKNAVAFRTEITKIQAANNKQKSAYGYFNTSGTLAFIGRINGLYEQLRTFDLSLGTFNNWRALFPVNADGTHPVIPGVVEAMRMYMEGLGKVTGFELLYPDFGYFIDSYPSKTEKDDNKLKLDKRLF